MCIGRWVNQMGKESHLDPSLRVDDATRRTKRTQIHPCDGLLYESQRLRGGISGKRGWHVGNDIMPLE